MGPPVTRQGELSVSSSTMRVVLDTNLVLSALVFQQGRLAALRTLWQSESIIPLVSHATAAELMRALTYPKFKLTRAERNVSTCFEQDASWITFQGLASSGQC